MAAAGGRGFPQSPCSIRRCAARCLFRQTSYRLWPTIRTVPVPPPINRMWSAPDNPTAAGARATSGSHRAGRILAKMDQHQVPFVPEQRKHGAVLLLDGRQRGRGFPGLPRGLRRERPPRGPAHAHHLVQNCAPSMVRAPGDLVFKDCCISRLLLYRVRRMLKSRSMYPDVHLVIQLQSLDQKIAALEKEVAALPKHIAAIEKALESHMRKLEADRAALTANQKDRKKLDGDIQVHQQKISKLRDQMLGAKTNEQYKAFQHEIEFIEKEIRKAEDRILELMTESEPLDQNVKKAEKALAEEKKSVEAEKSQARERTAADQKELDVLRQQRGESVAKLPKPSLAAYEKIRKRFSNGTVVAEAVNGRCSGCQINLRPQFLQDLKKRRPVDVLRAVRAVPVLQPAGELRRRRNSSVTPFTLVICSLLWHARNSAHVVLFRQRESVMTATIGVRLSIADTIWLATALLHQAKPHERVQSRHHSSQSSRAESLSESRSVNTHLSTHCVASKKANPATLRILTENLDGSLRLFRSGDSFHPTRRRVGPSQAERTSTTIRIFYKVTLPVHQLSLTGRQQRTRFWPYPVWARKCGKSSEGAKRSFCALCADYFPGYEPEVMPKNDLDRIWVRIKRHGGEEFRTVRGEPFSYDVHGNIVVPRPQKGTPTARQLSKSDFEKAWARKPLSGPNQIKDLQGASYIYGILTDPRISAS